MFCAITGRTDVTAVHVDEVDHGTALRARISITGRDDLPSRAFVKLAPVRPAERLFNRMMGLAHNESELYRLLGAELGDVLPRGYGARSDPRQGRAVVIMEDLTERGARFTQMADGCTADEAIAIARALGTLHQKFWLSERIRTGDLAMFSPSASRSTRYGPHAYHLLHTIPKSFNDIVTPDLRVQTGRLIKRRWAIARLMDSQPHTLIHGDTHLGNVCFVGEQPLLFDWQLAACGPAVKDLAYFACTSIDVPIRRAVDEDLVRNYVAALNADGTTRLRFDQAWDAYRLLAFTAFVAAGVTAAFGSRLQSPAATRAGLQRAVEGIRDLDSLQLLNRNLANES